MSSKYGFSVVAPISVISPSSTAGSSASCWALLKRWISSRKRIVRRPVEPEPLAGPRQHLAHVPDGGRHGRQLLELRAGRVGDDPRERRLARAGRAVEHERRHAVGLDREPQRPARPDHVLLADELVERLRPQPPRERRDLVQPPPGRLVEKIAHCAQVCSGAGEASLGRGHLRSPGRRGQPGAGRSARAPRRRSAGERWLVLETGSSASALRAARAGADVTTIDGAAPIAERVAAEAEDEGLAVRADVGSVEHLPYDDASFDVLASDFGLIYADGPRRTSRPSSRASRGPAAGSGSRPGSPTRSSASSTAASPTSRSRAASPRSGGARSTSSRCWPRTSSSSSTTAASGSRPTRARSCGSSFSTTAPPVTALLAKLDDGGRRGVPPRVRRAVRGLPQGRPRLRAAPVPAHAREAALTRRGGRAPAGADPRRHVEPARQRDRGGGAAARLPRGRGRRVRAVREGARAGEPRRAPAGHAAAARRSRCSRTPTSCPPTRASGAPTRSAASCATASSGAAARST